MHRQSVVVGFALVVLTACSSSSSGGSAPVIESIQPAPGVKAADGKYDLKILITAHDDGKIVSARLDFPSDDPPRIVGTEVPVNQQSLASSPITFRLDGSQGPGSGDCNLVLTDDSGQIAKKKTVVTLGPP